MVFFIFVLQTNALFQKCELHRKSTQNHRLPRRGAGVEKILEILHNNHYDVSRSSLYKHAARIRETGRYERQDGKLQIFLIADGRIFVLEVVAGREVHALMTTSLELSSWHPVKMGNVVTVQNVRLSRT